MVSYQTNGCYRHIRFIRFQHYFRFVWISLTFNSSLSRIRVRPGVCLCALGRSFVESLNSVFHQLKQYELGARAK